MSKPLIPCHPWKNISSPITPPPPPVSQCNPINATFYFRHSLYGLWLKKLKYEKYCSIRSSVFWKTISYNTVINNLMEDRKNISDWNSASFFFLLRMMDIFLYHPPPPPGHTCNHMSDNAPFQNKFVFSKQKQIFLKKFKHFEILINNPFTESRFYILKWIGAFWKYQYNVKKKNHYNNYSMFRFERWKTKLRCRMILL